MGEMCETCMCGTCKIVMNVLVLLAGVGLTGFVPGLNATISGWLIVLAGLGGLLHAAKMCPMCKGK